MLRLRITCGVGQQFYSPRTVDSKFAWWSHLTPNNKFSTLTQLFAEPLRKDAGQIADKNLLAAFPHPRHGSLGQIVFDPDHVTMTLRDCPAVD
jgi:hypothetical protein